MASHRCPHRCPVCNGAGRVDRMLYEMRASAGTNIEMVRCLSCGGTGVVWHDAPVVDEYVHKLPKRDEIAE